MLTRAGTLTKALPQSIAQIGKVRNDLEFDLLDADLSRIAFAAEEYLQLIENGAAPRWLTLSGPCGTGKTHLARRIFDLSRSMGPRHGGSWSSLLSPYRFIDWRSFCDGLLDGKWFLADEAIDAWMAVIDDIGTNYDRDGLLISKLDRILNCRLGKWTVITTNLEIGALEARIRSRIFRNGSLVVELPKSAIDFSQRG